MKKYKIITLLLLALIGLNSCNDFLTTELTDPKVTSDSYYKTPTEANTALVGCYDGLDLISNSTFAMPVISEVFSDNCLGGSGASDGFSFQMMDEFNKMLSPSDLSLFSANWKKYYQAIFRCNTLLLKLNQVKWDTTGTNLSAQYESETKFIRAYCYFEMVRLWEKVPLVLVPTVGIVPQAEPAETYAQIMSDLRFAANNLPAIPYSGSTVSGRITKWAAESLLARVYLFYDGYYGSGDNSTTIGGETKTTVLAAVEDVILNSNHDLISNFTTLWPAASLAKKVAYVGENNKEVVFAIKHSSGDNSGNVTLNAWMTMIGLRGGKAYPPYSWGYGGATVDPKLWAAFTATDTRRSASILSVVDEKIAYTSASDTREYTGYFLKKYMTQSDSLGNLVIRSQDYFAIRYSDVLLMAAELGSTKTTDYYNRVHQRAIPTAVAVASVTKADILAERRLEFAGEGLRYWDLLRQGLTNASQTIANNTSLSLLKNNKTTPTVAELQGNIMACRGFQQIPYDEITLSNGQLIQNAGW